MKQKQELEINKKETQKINRNITAARIRLIKKDGTMYKDIVDLKTALKMSEYEGLDLVEMDSKTEVAVCKIMCFSKHRYDLKKKKQNLKKQQKSVETKIIKFRYNIDCNDLQYKINNASKFLASNYKVEVSVFFRGRERDHIDKGEEKIILFRDSCLAKFSKLEHNITKESNNKKISLLLVPKGV